MWGLSYVQAVAIGALQGSTQGVAYTAVSVPLPRVASPAAQAKASHLVGEPSSPTTMTG